MPLHNMLFSKSLSTESLKLIHFYSSGYSSGILALIVSCIISGNVFASQPSTKPIIYAYSLEFRLKEGGTNQYNELFNVLQNEGLEFDLKILPFKRIMSNFKTEDKLVCAFPTSKNAIEKSAPEISSLPIIISDGVDQISLRVFTRPESPTITSLEELKGKTVALWNGLDPTLLFKGAEIKIETTPNELVRVKMLNAHRIDAILGFTPDVILAAQQLNLLEPHYDNKLALFRDEGASIVCKDSPQNRAFIKEFNTILKQLKTSGQLQQILGPHVELAP
jgi:hypothetical protein